MVFLLMRSYYMGFCWIVWNYPTETAGSTSRIKNKSPFVKQTEGLLWYLQQKDIFPPNR